MSVLPLAFLEARGAQPAKGAKTAGAPSGDGFFVRLAQEGKTVSSKPVTQTSSSLMAAPAKNTFIAKQGYDFSDLQKVTLPFKDMSPEKMRPLLDAMGAKIDALGEYLASGNPTEEGLSQYGLQESDLSEMMLVIQKTLEAFQNAGLDHKALESLKGIAEAFEQFGMESDAALERAMGFIAMAEMVRHKQQSKGMTESGLDGLMFVTATLLQEQDAAALKQPHFSGADVKAGSDILLSTMRGEELLPAAGMRSALDPTGRNEQAARLADEALARAETPQAEAERTYADALRGASEQALGTVGREGVQSRTDKPTYAHASVKEPVSLGELLSASRAVFSVSGSEDGNIALTDASGDPVLNAGADSLKQLFDKQLAQQTATLTTGTSGGAERAAVLLRQADISGQTQIQFRHMLKSGGGEVKMLLNPPELGELDIHLKISNGKVSGVIAAQSAEVLEHMARDLKFLQDALADAGMHFSEEGLSFRIKEEQEGRGGQQSDAQAEQGQEQADAVETRHARWQDPDRLLDLDI